MVEGESGLPQVVLWPAPTQNVEPASYVLDAAGGEFRKSWAAAGEEPVVCDRPQLASVGGFGFRQPERKCGVHLQPRTGPR